MSNQNTKGYTVRSHSIALSSGTREYKLNTAGIGIRDDVEVVDIRIRPISAGQLDREGAVLAGEATIRGGHIYLKDRSSCEIMEQPLECLVDSADCCREERFPSPAFIKLNDSKITLKGAITTGEVIELVVTYRQ